MLTRLLLVEDNPGDVLLLQETLDCLGAGRFVVTTVASLGEAEGILAEQKFDAVLLDLSLPDSCGLDTVTRCAAAAPGTAIVVLTGLAEEEEAALDAFHRGAQDYLVKGKSDARTIVRSIRYAVERKQEEEKLHKLNRTLRALVNSNQALTYATEEGAYLEAVCRIIVEDCGYSMVWVGYAEDDPGKTVRPVAYAGLEQGYLDTLNVTWADAERGRGPTGTAIRTGRVCTCRNMLTDPAFLPWREEARRRGYASSIVLPLTAAGKAFGAMTIYSRLADAFSDDETKMLTELAGDFSYGITSLRLRAQRNATEQRLRLLSEITAELLASDQPQQIVELLCRKVADHLGCQAFFNFLTDETSGRLHLNACGGIPEEAMRNIEWLDYGVAVCGCVARDGRRIVAEHIQTLPDPRTELVRSFGIQAYACHPLMNQGRVIGTLSFGSRIKASFSEDDLALMKAVADHVAIAMQRIRLLKSLEQHARDAQAANVAKSQFLANMSHELRTPMNAILGMTDLALNEPLSDRVRDYLQTAKESADLLLEILNEILDFSRIEAGRFEVEQTPFSLAKTVEQVARTLAVRAHEKGLSLFYNLPGDLPDCFIGDPSRLRQILMNLVGNAIKFTPKGEVVVCVKAAGEAKTEETGRGGERETEAGNAGPRPLSPSPPLPVSLTFSVCDTGIGIAPEQQQRVFLPFTQADASTTRRYGGTGLGLAISQRLVELMGGRIRLESEPGRGSTFSFTIPLIVEEQPGVPDETPAADQEALRDLPVLVVTESVTSRRILRDMLTGWRMRPEEADDVGHALTLIHGAAAAARSYRLVLADAVMPGIDGFTLAEWIKNQPELAGPVVLMLSATDRQNFADQCRETAAVYLEKPISRSALFDAMVKALGMGGPRHAHPREPKVGALASAPARPLRVLVAEDTPANQKLVAYVLDGRGHTVEVALHGQEALDLLDSRDFDVVLMDVQMPVMDGFQATQAIRKLGNRTKACVPIVAMTAHALKGDRERCLAAGMDAYVSKPIQRDELIETIERLAANGRESPARTQNSGTDLRDLPFHEESTSPNPSCPCDSLSIAAPAVPLAAFNLNEAVSACLGDYSVFQEMVSCFFDEADRLVAQMQGGLDSANAEAIHRAAHRLKNTVAYLGARAATDATKLVEQVSREGDLADAASPIQGLIHQLALLKSALAPHRGTAMRAGASSQ